MGKLIERKETSVFDIIRHELDKWEAEWSEMNKWFGEWRDRFADTFDLDIPKFTKFEISDVDSFQKNIEKLVKEHPDARISAYAFVYENGKEKEYSFSNKSKKSRKKKKNKK